MDVVLCDEERTRGARGSEYLCDSLNAKPNHAEQRVRVDSLGLRRSQRPGRILKLFKEIKNYGIGERKNLCDDYSAKGVSI